MHVMVATYKMHGEVIIIREQIISDCDKIENAARREGKRAQRFFDNRSVDEVNIRFCVPAVAGVNKD